MQFNELRACLAGLLLVTSCGDDNPVACPDDLRWPLRVEVDPRGLPIDSVTAHNREAVECSGGSNLSGDGTESFSCPEQGGGTYRVKVTSGDFTWTKSVKLHADECHVTDRAKLRFELDPATADGVPQKACTDILLLPIQVTIDPHGLTVDSVTSHNEGEKTLDCQHGFRSRTMFGCPEQGAGTYIVQVTSGDATWTQSVELHADECHVTDIVELDFDLDLETAD